MLASGGLLLYRGDKAGIEIQVEQVNVAYFQDNTRVWRQFR
jgi:hypothetical protein